MGADVEYEYRDAGGSGYRNSICSWTPTTLWTLAREGHTAECDIRFVPGGTEVRILRDGALFYSRILATPDDACEWADQQRAELAAQNWPELLPLPSPELHRPAFDELWAGAPIDYAIEAFYEGCRHHDRELWHDIMVHVDWARKLRACVKSPATAEQATAFRDVIFRRGTVDDLVNWICSGCRTSWSTFVWEYRRRAVKSVWRTLRRNFALDPIRPPYPRNLSYNSFRQFDQVIVFFSSDAETIHLFDGAMRMCSCGALPEQLARARVKAYYMHGHERLAGYTWIAGATVCPRCAVLVQRFDTIWSYQRLVMDPELRFAASDAS